MYLNLSINANVNLKLRLKKICIEEIPYYIINREYYISILFINFLIFLSYIQLSNERPGLIINILYLFKKSLLSATIILNNEQYLKIVFN